MKDGWQASSRDDLVEGIGLWVVGVKFLERAMEFEAARAVLFKQTARLASTHFAFGRIDAHGHLSRPVALSAWLLSSFAVKLRLICLP